MAKAMTLVALVILPILGVSVHARDVSSSEGAAPPPEAKSSLRDQGGDPQALIDSAVGVIEQMKRDPRAAQMLERARGVFVVPGFSRRAALAGEQPTAALLIVRSGGGWGSPVFFDTGPISLGAHAGADIGALAAILLRDEAVRRFTAGRRFTISQDAGFNMANHAAGGVPSLSEGDDVILWSDAAGLFAGTSVRLNEVRADERDNERFYGREGSVEELMRAQAGDPRAEQLRAALPG